jgi:hypothetical protein
LEKDKQFRRKNAGEIGKEMQKLIAIYKEHNDGITNIIGKPLFAFNQFDFFSQHLYKQAPNHETYNARKITQDNKGACAQKTLQGHHNE